MAALAAAVTFVSSATADAPVVTVPSDMTVEATGPTGAMVTFTATATDTEDGTDPVTCAPVSGSTFALGLTKVTCSATDSLTNTGSNSFNVTVRDTTPPSFSGVPSNQTIEATGSSGATATYTTPSASDLVDGATGVGCSPASGSTFALGTTAVTCTTTDAHSNAATATFTITVHDTTPPSFSGVPSNQTIEATGPSGATAAYTVPTASDLVGGNRFVGCSISPGTVVPIGQTTVTCTAKDDSGNSASVSFTITVQDTTPPALALPKPIVVNAVSPEGAGVTFRVSALDLVDGMVKVSCSRRSGGRFAIGTTRITCTATDAHGNKATGTFTIHVRSAAEQLAALGVNAKGTKTTLCTRLARLKSTARNGTRRARLERIRTVLACPSARR